MAGRNPGTRADHDARADTCGKLWAAFGHKWTHLRTFYRRKLLISIAAQLVWPYSGGPNYFSFNFL